MREVKKYRTKYYFIIDEFYEEDGNIKNEMSCYNSGTGVRYMYFIKTDMLIKD